MKLRQTTAAIMVLVLLSAGLPVSVYATEETREQIRQAEEERDKAKSQLNQTKENLGTLNEQKNSIEGTLSELNTQLSQVSNNLSELETKITEKEAEIEETNQKIDQAYLDLDEATAVREEQYQNMKKQVQFLYEKSDYLYMEMFFSSRTISEMLNRGDYIEQLSAYEDKKLKEYMETQAMIVDIVQELENAKTKLETDMEELDSYRVQAETEQNRVSGLVRQANVSLISTSNQISDAEGAALAYEEEIKEQELNISALKIKLEEEMRMAQLAAQSGWRDISEVSFVEGDRYLLANLIYCEAGGEPYEGQVAVGSVVMNRVLSSVYPNTVVGVIYQSGQFSPVASGRLALALAEGRATEKCYQAADEAMSGTTNVGNCVYFRTPVEGITPKYRIGGHIFY